MLAFGLLYVGWLANSWIEAQPVLLAGFAGLAGSGLRDLRRTGERTPTRLLVTGASLFLLVTLVWNSAFYLYIAFTGYGGDAFRGFMRTRQAPLFGHPALPASWLAVTTVLAVALVVLRIRVLGRGARGPATGEVAAWVILLGIAFGLSDGWPRLLELAGHYESFGRDIPRFAGAGDVLARFVASMPELSVHNRHYPPGNLLLLGASAVPALGRAVVLAGSGASVWLVGAIGDLLGLAERPRRAAILLYAVSPGVLILPSVSLTPLFMFVVAIAVWSLLQALVRERSLGAPLLGASLALATLLSFSVALVGLWIAVFTLAGVAAGRLPMARVARTGFVALPVYVLILGGLWWATGFDVVRCFLEAVEQNRTMMGSGFDTPTRYLIRSSGNLLDYFLLLGIPQALLCVWAFIRSRRGDDRGSLVSVATLATLLTLLFAAFSGLHFLETGRIWIYLTPLMCVIAANALIALEAQLGRSLTPTCIVSALLMALVLELARTTLG